MKRIIMRAMVVVAAIAASPGCGGGGGANVGAVQNAHGVYGGSTEEGHGLLAIVLSDGRFWIMYQTDSASPRGFVYGIGSETDDRFVSSSATQFNFDPPAIAPSSLSVAVLPRQRLTGTLRLDGEDRNAIVLFSDYPPPTSVEAFYFVSIRGATSAGSVETSGTMTVSSTGQIAGTLADACTLAGSMRARGDVNVHDLSLTFSGTSCPATSPMQGIALVESPGRPNPSTRMLSGFAATAGNTAGLIMYGISP